MRRSPWKRFILFVRYDATGVASFVGELGLLYGFLNFLVLPYYIAVPLAFTITATLQWALCHLWVFRSSNRPPRIEYEYFISILLCGLVFATGFVAVCVKLFGLNPLIARIFSSAFTGLWGFYMNARFNFHSRLFQ